MSENKKIAITITAAIAIAVTIIICVGIFILYLTEFKNTSESVSESVSKFEEGDIVVIADKYDTYFTYDSEIRHKYDLSMFILGRFPFQFKTCKVIRTIKIKDNSLQTNVYKINCDEEDFYYMKEEGLRKLVLEK